MNKAIIEAQDVQKVFRLPNGEPLHLLNAVNFAVFEGQKVAIYGESGSGKSTFLFLLGGLEIPSSGEIYWEGKLIKPGDAALQKKRGHFIAYVFQSYWLVDELTVLENVLLPLRVLGQKISHSHREKAIELLEWMGLQSMLQQLPPFLSGGERQRVAVARALLPNPKVLLADEPTGNLDQKTGERILDLLVSACENTQTSLVLVTHNPAFAKKMDATYNLVNGELKPCK